MGTFAPIRQDEYPATDDLQCIQVYIPEGDEYKALLAGFIAFLTNAASYEDPESAQAEGIAAVFDTGYALIDWNGCPEPEVTGVSSQVILFPINMTVASGNAVLQSIDTAQRFNSYYQQNAAVINQALDAHLWLAAGDWSYRLTCVKTAGSGILTLHVDDADGDSALNANHDFYNASTLRNQFFTGTFTLPVAGDTFIGFETNSKNVSSSGYLQQVTCLEMWKTDDP